MVESGRIYGLQQVGADDLVEGLRSCYDECNAHMTLGMLGVLDAGFKALKVAHGDGALEAASRILSEA